MENNKMKTILKRVEIGSMLAAATAAGVTLATRAAVNNYEETLTTAAKVYATTNGPYQEDFQKRFKALGVEFQNGQISAKTLEKQVTELSDRKTVLNHYVSNENVNAEDRQEILDTQAKSNRALVAETIALTTMGLGWSGAGVCSIIETLTNRQRRKLEAEQNNELDDELIK